MMCGAGVSGGSSRRHGSGVSSRNFFAKSEEHAVRNLDKKPSEFGFVAAFSEAFGVSAHFRQIPVSLLRDIGHEMLSLRVELNDRRHGAHSIAPRIAVRGHDERKRLRKCIVKAHAVSMQLAVGATGEVAVKSESPFKCPHAAYYTKNRRRMAGTI